jgi:hypothetical protein
MAELSAAAQVRAMMLPTVIPEKPREWETFKDPETGCDYHLNVATGESKWAGSAADQVRSQLHAPADAARADDDDDDSAPLRLELVQPRVRPSDVERCDVFDDEDDELSAAAEEAAVAREWRDRGMLRTVRRRPRARMSCGERCCDRALMCLEATACEQPLALLEALGRGPFYALGGLLLHVLAVLVCASRGCDCVAGAKVARKANAFFREGALFFFAALSLAVPGAALFVYRDAPLDDADWDVRPLPTLVGSVDPRRFWAFYLGRCSLANNGYYDPLLGSLDWPWAGAVLHPPTHDQDDGLLVPPGSPTLT